MNHKSDKKYTHIIEIEANLPNIEYILKDELTFFDPKYIKVVKVLENWIIEPELE